MSDCIFCKIVAKEIPSEMLYEDDLIVAFNDIRPKAKIHVLVVAKEHIKNLTEIKPNHEKLIFHMMQQSSNLAKKFNLSGFRVITNIGRDGGQEIDHLHFHVLGGGKLPGF